jgi:hypothetical protein
MMFRIGILTALLLLLSGCAQQPEPQQAAAPAMSAAQQAQQQAADQQYQLLLADAQQAPEPRRLSLLREAYIKTSAYKPYHMSERAISSLMFEAIAKKDWQQCLSHTSKLLAEQFISLNGHYGAMVCQFESGNTEQGEYHQEVLDSLVAAIWQSGDGKTPETAFFCTSTTELYAFINLHGFNAKAQALVWHEEQPYDLMTIVNPRDEHEFSWYFNISAQMARGFVK